MYEKRKLHFREIEVAWQPSLHLSWIEEWKESKALTMEYKMRAICRKQRDQVAREERRTNLGRLLVPRACCNKTAAIETKMSMHLHLTLRCEMHQEDAAQKKKLKEAMTRKDAAQLPHILCTRLPTIKKTESWSSAERLNRNGTGHDDALVHLIKTLAPRCKESFPEDLSIADYLNSISKPALRRNAGIANVNAWKSQTLYKVKRCRTRKLKNSARKTRM